MGRDQGTGDRGSVDLSTGQRVNWQFGNSGSRDQEIGGLVDLSIGQRVNRFLLGYTQDG